VKRGTAAAGRGGRLRKAKEVEEGLDDDDEQERNPAGAVRAAQAQWQQNRATGRGGKPKMSGQREKNEKRVASSSEEEEEEEGCSEEEEEEEESASSADDRADLNGEPGVDAITGSNIYIAG